MIEGFIEVNLTGESTYNVGGDLEINPSFSITRIVLILFQLLLGILTLININAGIPLVYGVLHQLVGILFFISLLFLLTMARLFCKLFLSLSASFELENKLFIKPNDPPVFKNQNAPIQTTKTAPAFVNCFAKDKYDFDCSVVVFNVGAVVGSDFSSR